LQAIQQQGEPEGWKQEGLGSISATKHDCSEQEGSEDGNSEGDLRWFSSALLGEGSNGTRVYRWVVRVWV
jgi:hypothetical protein